jgi:PAS domain S-box-containing protein
MSVFRSRDDTELFRLAIEQGPDAVIVADLDGAIQVWNAAAGELFGYSEQEAIGRSLDIIIPAHLRQAHWEGFQKAVTNGRTKYGGHAIKTRATHKSGEKRYVHFAFSILRDQEDKVIGAVGTAREAEP